MAALARRSGTPNLGGPIATASGLVFIGATTDFFLRAFEPRRADELWKGRLPTAGHATPMTYRLRPDGRQYVVIAAGGHGLLGTPPSDALIAFALSLGAPRPREPAQSCADLLPIHRIRTCGGESRRNRRGQLRIAQLPGASPLAWRRTRRGAGGRASFAVSCVTVFSISIVRLCSFVIRP